MTVLVVVQSNVVVLKIEVDCSLLDHEREAALHDDAYAVPWQLTQAKLEVLLRPLLEVKSVEGATALLAAELSHVPIDGSDADDETVWVESIEPSP